MSCMGLFACLFVCLFACLLLCLFVLVVHADKMWKCVYLFCFQSYINYVAITRLQVSIVGGACYPGAWLMPACIKYRIVVGGIQMAEILMQKLPDVFHVYFRREGNVFCSYTISSSCC